ncbi:MAG: metal-dependent hydrolase [Halobacteriota archaeon]
MMLPTHALSGMVLALPVVLVAPELSGLALVAGLIGGILPDLDMYVGHRKTLHYPVYYSLGAAVAVPLAVVVQSAVTLAVAVLLVAAAVHSVADAFGGGLELRPWEKTSNRAVYDHYNGRWVAPRRWIPYDGSPADFLLSLSLAVPLLSIVDGPLRWIVLATVAVAGLYAVFRRRLATVAQRVVAVLPERLHTRVPARYL